MRHDMLGVLDIKAIDSLLITAVSDERDVQWKFCRPDDMSMVYGCFRKGNGPDEFVSVPWLYDQQFISENGNTECMIYDFTRGGIKVMDIGRTLTERTVAMKDCGYKIPRNLFGWRYLGQGRFIVKEVDKFHTREDRYILSDKNMKKIDIDELNNLTVDAGKDINIVATMMGSSDAGDVVVEACMHLNNLYLYSPDGTFFKTICIGPHGYDTPAVVQNRNMDEIRTYYEGIECFPDFFCALYTDDSTDKPAENITASKVVFFDWDGNPLARVTLDRHVTSVTICRQSGIMYAVDYTTEEILSYDMSDIIPVRNYIH